ncbi:MAG: DUF1127 domain-containing protein [Kiloniellaceae bacterium]
MSTLYTEPLRESATTAALAPALLRPFRTLAQSLTRTVAAWQARNERRKQLRALPDYLLRDVGLTREDVGHSLEDALKETRTPFWRP